MSANGFTQLPAGTRRKMTGKKGIEVEDGVSLEHNPWPPPGVREEVFHVSQPPAASIPGTMKRWYSQEAIYGCLRECLENWKWNSNS